MGVNLAGLGIIYNNISTLNQQHFQLLAVPGSLTLVVIDGVIHNPDTYTIDKSVLILDNPIPAGRWVYVVSGQGGTFVPQSYVDDVAAQKANAETVTTQLNAKASKSGADFTGHITVQEPVNAMNPATKQMFDSLPDIATPDYVDDAVASMVTQEVFDTTVEDLVSIEDKGVANGVTENDEDGKVKSSQVPLYLLYNKTDVYIIGELTVGKTGSMWRERFSGVINTILLHIDVPSVGDDVKLNIMRDSTPVYTNPVDYITIPAGQNSVEHNFVSPPTFNADEVLGIRVEQIGSTTAGSYITARIEVTHLPI